MRRRVTYGAGVLLVAFLVSQSASAQSSNSNQGGKNQRFDITRFLASAGVSRQRGFSLFSKEAQPVAAPGSLAAAASAGFPNLQVLGSGTQGRLTRWSGVTSANSFIGDSTIYEDKFGNVGVGTDTPTSKLTVGGIVESFSGRL